MPEVKTNKFKTASVKALADANIQRALGAPFAHFVDGRKSAIDADFTEESWESMRDRAAATKAHTIERLDYYLDLVDKNVRRNGGHVYFADDAAHANQIVLDIARQHDVKTVIKSKSMVSEEMGVNAVLEKNGIAPVETDLGEYIIQLAKETPFHLIAPAVHKTKGQVSDLFEKFLDSAPTDDIEKLCIIARDVLRENFAKADMGISGANFIVAETGTVVLVTNEGNGRMTTSAPRIHVAISGMEKLLPSIEDVGLFLRLLTLSATGQRITSYNSFISGPRATTDEDGPEEFHLILVDNGRLNLLKDETLREALSCIRCGACLNHCPVYRKVGGHAYGWVYPGPIGAIVSPMLTGLKQGKDLPYASTLCGSCRDVCPVKIDLPKLLLDLRHKVVKSGAGTMPERLGIRQWHDTMKTRKKLEGKARLGRMFQGIVVRKGFITRLPLPIVNGWTKTRDFPALAPRSFAEIWRDDLSGGDRP
jgi:L-lactate dehydrogenase complex protein LldF